MGTMIRASAILITPEVLSLIAGIDEFKGGWCALDTLESCQPMRLWRDKKQGGKT